jgi:hypothetical protein
VPAPRLPSALGYFVQSDSGVSGRLAHSDPILEHTPAVTEHLSMLDRASHEVIRLRCARRQTRGTNRQSDQVQYLERRGGQTEGEHILVRSERMLMRKRRHVGGVIQEPFPSVDT